MARNRKKPVTLELSERDYGRLRRRLEDLADADTRKERREAEDALERLAEELEVADDVLDGLIAGDVQLEDDDDDEDDDDRGRSRSSSTRRRRRDDDEDDDDRGRSRSRRRDGDRGSSGGTGSTRSVRVVDRDDDDDQDDDDDRGRGRARSLRELKDDPTKPPARRRREREPARTPETTHWFHRPMGDQGAAS